MKIPFQFQKRALACVLGLTASLTTLSAGAADYLAAEPMQGKKISLDGMLREWPRGFAKLKNRAGRSSGNSALIGYDKKHIYVAAKLADKKIVRTRSGSKGEDHLLVEIYVPGENGGGKSHRIQVFPGNPGKMAGLVKVDGRKVSNAKAVEAPSGKGIHLEAKIPWSALSRTKRVRIGLRGKLAYHNANSLGRIKQVTATSHKSGRSLPPLTTAPETGLIQALLGPKGMRLTPAKEVYGDLTGKGGVEKVALYGHFLSIVGPGYKGGKQFYFNELDVERAEQVRRLQLLDFNGDGKKEIIVQKRLGKEDKYREVIQVLQIGRDGAPLQVFMHEMGITTADGKIKNKITISGRGKTARIEIAQGESKGFEPGSYNEPTLGAGIPSALLPWQSIKSKSFGWKGAGLALLDEESWEPKMKPSSSGSVSSSSTPKKDAPPPPRPPSADEMLDRVYALFKGDRGVSRNKKPSFDFVTDVVEDKQMERVLIHDRDLVVFGKGFKKGLSYTYLTIGVKEAKDILSVTTRDLVGDGKAEILVHAVLNAKASESLGGDIVGRQALFVYKIVGEKLTRIFAAETGRALKGNRILSAVAFIPRGGALDIELRPLRAIGWDQKSYPFPEDRHPAGGLEPLLLPWSTVGSRRYSFQSEGYRQN